MMHNAAPAQALIVGGFHRGVIILREGLYSLIHNEPLEKHQEYPWGVLIAPVKTSTYNTTLHVYETAHMYHTKLRSHAAFRERRKMYSLYTLWCSLNA
jgi:hypothetical protein